MVLLKESEVNHHFDVKKPNIICHIHTSIDLTPLIHFLIWSLR